MTPCGPAPQVLDKLSGVGLLLVGWSDIVCKTHLSGQCGVGDLELDLLL